MTPEEYIEQLIEAQRDLDSVKEQFDLAIIRMEHRMRTGNTYHEQKSHLSALAGLTIMNDSGKKVFETVTDKIDY
jgi:arginine decarboxylase-like protein